MRPLVMTPKLEDGAGRGRPLEGLSWVQGQREAAGGKRIGGASQATLRARLHWLCPQPSQGGTWTFRPGVRSRQGKWLQQGEGMRWRGADLIVGLGSPSQHAVSLWPSGC